MFRTTNSPRPHVVVVGGGFGGLTLARSLDGDARVTLIDRHNYHTFQPLLYQVATAGLNPQDIGHSIRNVLRRRPDAGFRLGEVTGIDANRKTVRLADGAEINYDHVVLAAGAVTADYGIPGVAEHAFPLKSIPEAVRLRNHILERFERADAAVHRDGESTADPADLTFVVAGAGPTGVELAGAISELVHVLRKDHPGLDLGQVRIVLVEMADEPLQPYKEGSRRYTRRALEERGVEVRTGTAIEKVDADRVLLSDGEDIATRTLVWTAGVTANPLADVLGFPQTRGGRIEVGGDLRVPGHEDVWIIGDLAGATDPDGDLLPQVAPVAMQQARHVADQILRVEAGRATKPFRYVDKGQMATIGRNDAVAELPGGIRFGGRLAWAAWLGLHLVYLIGFRNRASVLLNWTWNYFTYDRGSRMILDLDEEELARELGGEVGLPA